MGGRVLKQPELARTLERLSAEGPKLLYGGALGRAIVAHLETLGGCMTMADLEEFAPRWKEPVQAYFLRQAAGWKLVGFERLPSAPAAAKPVPPAPTGK